MARQTNILWRGAAAHWRRLATWLALCLALLALVVGVWPAQASAEVRPITNGAMAADAPALAALRRATLVTPASHAISAALAEHASVDAAFQTYYDTNAGPQLLGAPLTPAFLTSDGLAQFFENGELVLRDAPSTAASQGDITLRAPKPSRGAPCSMTCSDSAAQPQSAATPAPSPTSISATPSSPRPWSAGHPPGDPHRGRVHHAG